MNLTEFPAEILCKIARHSKWAQIREVCRDFRSKIDPVTISCKFLSAVYVVTNWSFEDVKAYVARYRVEMYRRFMTGTVFPTLGAAGVKVTTVMHFAAVADRVDILTAFHKTGGDHEKFMLAACISGSVNAVKYYASLGEAVSTYSVIPDGCLDILYIKSRHGCEPADETMVGMLESGKLANFRYLMVNGGRSNVQIQCAAARLGHVSILKWMHSLGTRFSEEVMADAAKYGEINVIKFLYSVGCPMNEKSCERAAKWGHLAALQLLHSYSCPWNAKSTELAVRGHEWKILEWLLDNGCPVDAKTLKCLHGTRSKLSIVSELFRRVMSSVKFEPDVELGEISDDEDIDAKVSSIDDGDEEVDVDEDEVEDDPDD